MGQLAGSRKTPLTMTFFWRKPHQNHRYAGNMEDAIKTRDIGPRRHQSRRTIQLKANYSNPTT